MHSMDRHLTKTISIEEPIYSGFQSKFFVKRCVTVRDRDTMEQVRISVEKVKDYILERIDF